jgi:hypothetical protein
LKASKAKAVRFAALVAACGSPEIASLWRRPEEDKPFMQAVKQNRVLSLRQPTVGSKKDFGVVGFLREKNISYLIFPRTLKAFENRRIVGIHYNLIETPGPVGAPIKSATIKKRPSRKRPGILQPRWGNAIEPELEAAKISCKRFKVTIRFAAEMDVVDEVKAESKNAAVQIVERRARTPDFSKGTITRKVLKVTAL